MKKILLGVLLVSVLLLSVSCGKDTSTVPKTTGISFTAEMEFFENRYEAAVNVKSDGSAKAQITSPDTLKGLEFLFSGEGVTAKYSGLEYNYGKTEQPPTAAAEYLYKILNDVSKNRRQITLEDGRFYTDGRTENTEYRMYFGATGLPISANDEDGNFKIIFKNVTVTDSAAK